MPRIAPFQAPSAGLPVSFRYAARSPRAKVHLATAPPAPGARDEAAAPWAGRPFGTAVLHSEDGSSQVVLVACREQAALEAAVGGPHHVLTLDEEDAEGVARAMRVPLLLLDGDVADFRRAAPPGRIS